MKKKNIFKLLFASVLLLMCLNFSLTLPPSVMAGPGEDDMPFDPIEGPTNKNFDELNPLKNQTSPYAEQLSTPGGIVSRALNFALPIAGMLLFVLLVWGGFEILLGSAGSKSIDSGKQRIKAALIGFIMLFSSYWMAQIVQEIFGIRIL